MSGLIPLIKLIIDAGVFSPVAPTTSFRKRFRPKQKPTGVKQTDGPAFGELGLKRFF
jgi:hypothetical protein